MRVCDDRMRPIVLTLSRNALAFGLAGGSVDREGLAMPEIDMVATLLIGTFKSYCPSEHT